MAAPPHYTTPTTPTPPPTPHPPRPHKPVPAIPAGSAPAKNAAQRPAERPPNPPKPPSLPSLPGLPGLPDITGAASTIANRFAGLATLPPTGAIIDIPLGYVSPCDLREGDFLLALGLDPVSLCIATCGTSWGTSHCACIVRLPDGALYVAESRESYLRSLEYNGASGVVATPISRFLGSHSVTTAYRPNPPLTRAQILRIREAFRRRLGQPYRLNYAELCNAFCGCSLCPMPSRGLFCSQLVTSLYDSAGALKPHNVWCGLGCHEDCRRPTHSYRPYDLPYVIPNKRLGTVLPLNPLTGQHC